MKAAIAWECHDGGPDPLPKWYRLCPQVGRIEWLLGATRRVWVQEGIV